MYDFSIKQEGISVYYLPQHVYKAKYSPKQMAESEICSVDSRNEFPFHNLAIAFPVFAILESAPADGSIKCYQKRKKVGVPFEIARRTVDEHCDEENTVEIRDRGRSTDDKAPGEAHDPVGHIVLSLKVNLYLPQKSVWVSTGLRENCHQPFVRSRFLEERSS